MADAGAPILKPATSDSDESHQKMDEEAFARNPAETHRLDTEADDAQVSKKARTAKLVFHVRGEED